jgi:ATP-dependent DNA helicase PIF1
MNEKQTEIFKAFKSSEDNIAILGGAGTGKSFVFKKIIEECKEGNLNYYVTAMTGVAAELIGGRTLHSTLGLGFLKDVSTSEKLLFQLIKNNKKKVWEEIDILLIDEISMMSSEMFQLIDKTAQLIRLNDKLFGGIRLIVCGDFLQLGPVNPSMNEKKTLIFELEEWKNGFSKIFLLTDLMRQCNDLEWGELLDRLRFGNLTTQDKMNLFQRKNPEGNWADAIEIYCTNANVNAKNKMKFESLKAKGIVSYKFISRCSIKDLKRDDVELCVGTRVMHTRNNSMLSIWNGSMGIVVDFIFTKQVATGAKVFFDNGSIIDVNMVSTPIEFAKNKSVEVIYMPLRLAWAATIHRVQGCTLEKGIVDLRGMFATGQAYTALTRFKSIKDVKISSFEPQFIRIDPKCIEYYSSL